MSIRCERYIGYSLDIDKEIDAMSSEERESLLYGTYSVLNLINNSEGSYIHEKIKVIYDGISGQYCKLFYIISKDEESFYDECEVDKKINTMLKLVSVDMEVKGEMRKAYKAIFGKDLEHASLIKAEYLLHYC